MTDDHCMLCLRHDTRPRPRGKQYDWGGGGGAPLIGLPPQQLHSHRATAVKPDFHSPLSPVVNEIFHIGHAQIGETNRIGRKISFVLFTFKVQIFQFLRNFLAAKPIGFLS